MKKRILFAILLFASACLFSCSKSSSPTPTPSGMDLSIKLTYTNFDPTKDAIVGSIGGATATDVYSDWTVNGVERKNEDAISFDNSIVVSNATTISTNSKINNASLTIGGVAPQGSPYTVTVQATKNGKALDPVIVQIAGSTTVRSFTY